MKVLAATIAVLALSASLASAKDICVVDPNLGSFVFKKVKALKPGGTIPLTGIGTAIPTAAFPVYGSAMMNSDGSAKFAIFSASMSPGACPVGCNNVTETLASVDGSFNATGNFDFTGDGIADGATSWTVVDCSTITLP